SRTRNPEGEAGNSSRLDERRGNVLGWSDVDAAAQLAVVYPVKEINAKADREPDKETYPCLNRQTQHQHEAKEHTQNRKPWGQRHTKWTRAVGLCAPQNNHAEANEHECKKCSDIREISKRS